MVSNTLRFEELRKHSVHPNGKYRYAIVASAFGHPNEVRICSSEAGISIQSQIREQMSVPELHVFTLKFLALKKVVFSP